MSKLSIIAEFWEFVKERKKWVLTPIIIILLLLGTLVVYMEGSTIFNFIYTLF